MAIVDLVKWNGSPDILAWKFPSEELSTFTQLIVNESQEAFLVRGGVYEGPFGPGRHTLSTENIPLLRSAMGLPFGGQSPFSAEIWFVNKLVNLDVKWGTSDPIQLQDPKFQIMVPVRAFGQYGLRITDAKLFLLRLVGTLSSFSALTVSDYFRGVFTTTIKTSISREIIRNGISVLEIAPHLTSLSSALSELLRPEMAPYGISLTSFNITSINLPEDDPGVVSLKAALAKRAEMQIVGFNYQQERSFDVLQTAAGNEGTAGGAMGAGLGLGMGVGIGVPVGGAMSALSASINTNASGSADSGSPSQISYSATERIQLLKELSELRTQGILSDDEFASEKKKILER